MSSAIILAAGKSTRMQSELNKHLHVLHDKTVLQHIVDTVQSVVDDRIIIVVGYQKEKIKKSLKTFPHLIFVHQKEQLGTGHAVRVCKDVLNGLKGSTFILPGDTPLIKPHTLQKMKKKFTETKSLITLLVACVHEPGSYGRIILNEAGNVEKIVEARDATKDELAINVINSGIYLADISFLFQALENITNANEQREYYLTDIVAVAAQQKRVSCLVVDDENEIIGINTMKDLERVRNL